VGVSEGTVRRVLAEAPAQAQVAGPDEKQAGHEQVEPVDDCGPAPDADVPTGDEPNQAQNDGTGGDGAAAEDGAGGDRLPVLADPADRSVERVLARFRLIDHAHPVFTPAARVPLAGLFFALPGLAATGLLDCAGGIYAGLPRGFYGLDTVLVEAVLRALAGEPRAEGATRIDPVTLGRVLGLDRAPEVKTIRRKFTQLARHGSADQLIAAMAGRHLRAADEHDPDLAAVFYVDGHVRTYHGTRKIAKTHAPRLKFPAPATVETWVADAAGGPVLVVMAEPGASLASELRRILPDLRVAIGDQRRVLVGFDRGGWSPALFKEMHDAGFDVLTWRKGPVDDVADKAFRTLSFTDETGKKHTWNTAETLVKLPVDEQGNTFTMRQISRRDDGPDSKQVHILTSRARRLFSTRQVNYRMGNRWRLENMFRYGRMHYDLDSIDNYTVSDDDTGRLVPNPAKKTAYNAVTAARARYDRARATAEKTLLDLRSPEPGSQKTITNGEHDAATAAMRDAQADLDAAQAAHRAIPTRLPLSQVNPVQQILETETKLLTHAVKMAAFNTVTAIVRDLRVHTGYARADDEAHTLIRQILAHSGDIDPDPAAGTLTISLDPLPTGRATRAVAELCEHLTAAGTCYPGTDLLLRYAIKPERR
jgi:hypothetical protein